LFELLNDDSVSTIYCLTRRASSQNAVLSSLAGKDLHVTPEQINKIVAFNTCLDKPNFGIFLGDDMVRNMLDSVSLIIHTAWPVNFNLPLTDFEPHIQGLYNLIQFSLSVHRSEPAVMMFCSSVSTALGSPSDEIPEKSIELDHALMGYGQSKLVGERIVSNASKVGARAYSLRIGQVSGHSKKGLWNDSEALPLMIRSALTVKALPDLAETCSWLPVDNLACSILELAKTCSSPATREDKKGSCSLRVDGDSSIYNLCNSRSFPWSSLLETLQQGGFEFDRVSLEEWLHRLRESETRGEEHVNPAVKLIHHYEQMHGGQSTLGASKTKTFITEKAERDSVTLRNGRLRIVDDGILSCYARDWLTRWKTT
jgi:thioester reductase-like protein